MGTHIACLHSRGSPLHITHLPKKLEAVNDYHGAGDAFFAGFCTKYQNNNLKTAISFGATNAHAFLTRSENVVI